MNNPKRSREVAEATRQYASAMRRQDWAILGPPPFPTEGEFVYEWMQAYDAERIHGQSGHIHPALRPN